MSGSQSNNGSAAPPGKQPPARPPPKRIYKAVTLAEVQDMDLGRFRILLDGKPVRTPARAAEPDGTFRI